MSTAVQYVADLAHVREVSLLGTADLAFWEDRLRKEGLAPAGRDGKAQLLIVAAEAKFMGVPFREVSFSVLVSPPGPGASQDAAFLAQAFNSCRLFAFCERALFSTPYYYGDLRISTTAPVSIRLARGGAVVFEAEMRAGPSAPRRAPSRSGEEGWEGPVFLPGGRRGKGGPGKLLFARIRGHTRAYPFLPAEDAVTIRPSRGAEVLQALVDSQFAGKDWAVREDARHAKSKTYTRAEGLTGRPPGCRG
jgi:hypothetical protein